MALSGEVAKAANTRITQERARVEDFVITANITLIAAFVVMLTVSDRLVGTPTLLAAASLVCLVFSLLGCLWHKFRYPLRLRAWDAKVAEKAYEVADKVIAFNETFVKPNPQLTKALADVQSSGRKEENPEYVQMREVVVAHLRNMDSDLRAEHSRIFRRPLHEPNAKLLHAADVASRRIRYPAFGLGVVLFLAAVLTLLA